MFSGILLLATSLSGSANSHWVVCRGMCDASAVVVLDREHFLVGDDEDNILRVYQRTKGGDIVSTFDLSPVLRGTKKSPEADLEGAARIGDRVYWITSHARNQDGAIRPIRRRFFATTISQSSGRFVIRPVGRPYPDLLLDLVSDPRLKRFNLAAAARLAPKEVGALNIEGLCATPEGHLLLGFRNPVPDGKALLVPLLNPAEVIEGKRARFGDPRQLDLGGLGIRSLARAGNRYFVIAGSYDGEGPSWLHEWDGTELAPGRLNRPELKGLNPEAIEYIEEDGRGRLLVLSDDGTLKIGGVECKQIKDPRLKNFRATTVDL
jgi:hypothetical protein